MHTMDSLARRIDFLRTQKVLKHRKRCGDIGRILNVSEVWKPKTVHGFMCTF